MSRTDASTVAVIVPIYNARQHARACIESVLQYTARPYRLLMIDDGSPDKGVWRMIASVADCHGHAEAFRNGQNIGYTATINRGCALAGGADVVLLNSDTCVTAGWLEKMTDCARRHENVATVTPLSNAAGAFSVPVRNRVNDLPEWLTIADMGRLVESLSLRLQPRVPVGNGFCMYVTRRALDRAGKFDERRFPKGYGMENDFCMRAGRLGLIHLVEDSTFVYHKRSASFKLAKYPPLYLAEIRLRRMYPGYRKLVEAWLSADPLDEFRRVLKAHIAKAAAGAR